jgi:signal transduction histidine kinase
VRSPFTSIYLLHVILGCIVHRRQAAIWLATLAFASIATLAMVEYGFGVRPPLPLGAVLSHQPLNGQYVVTLLTIWGLLLGVITFMLLSVIRELRWRERLLHDTMEDLERLSDFRRDFLQIALHNLRSPIGVSTAHLQNLLRGYGGPLNTEQKSWIERCVARLRGLSDFLRDLRMLAVMDSCEVLHDNEQRGLDVRELLVNLEKEYEDLAEMHAHRLVLELPSELPRVRAVPRLLQEALANYVTNAIKYTPRGGRIVLRARCANQHVYAEVEDNGIGIAEENQGKLFDDFVRLEIDESAVSDASGSGLGLAIVKRVAECFQGKVYVKSEVGKGSTFGVELPELDL